MVTGGIILLSILKYCDGAVMEKRVDLLGATVKLQINEDDYDSFPCLCIATPVLR